MEEGTMNFSDSLSSSVGDELTNSSPNPCTATTAEITLTAHEQGKGELRPLKKHFAHCSTIRKMHKVQECTFNFSDSLSSSVEDNFTD